MNKQRFSTAAFLSGSLFLGSFFLSTPGFAQSNCPAPGFNCPETSLFTDGVYFVFGTSCCTSSGPACVQTFSDGLYIYNSTIAAGDMGCEADPAGGGQCACKTNQTPAGDGSGTGSNGELTFDPDDATAVMMSAGVSVDNFFIRVQNERQYYRCYNISYTHHGQVAGGKMAIRSDKAPTNFPILTYAATKQTVDGVHQLKVLIPISGGGTIETIFNIAQKHTPPVVISK